MIKEYLAGQFAMNSITSIDGSPTGIMTARGLRGNQSVEIDFYTEGGKLHADVYRLVMTQRPEDPEKPNGPKIKEMGRRPEPDNKVAEVTVDKIKGALGAAVASKPASGEAPAKAEKPAEPPPLKTVEERAAYEASQVPDFKKRIQEIQSEYAKLDSAQKTTKTEWLYVHEQLLADSNLKGRYEIMVEMERDIVAEALDGARDQIAKIRLTKGLEWKAVEMAKIKKVTPEQIANQRLLQIKDEEGKIVGAATAMYKEDGSLAYQLSIPPKEKGGERENIPCDNFDKLTREIQARIKAPTATAVAAAEPPKAK